MSGPSSSKGMRTRHQSGSKLTELVGPGKDFIPSEVPTLRAVIQQGILIKEELLAKQDKKDVHVSELAVKLVPMIVAQWQKSNAKFCPPVTIQDLSIKQKVERLWKRVEEVVRGRAKKSEKEKVLELLDRLFDITNCNHIILHCEEADSQCKDTKSCQTKAHIKCDCPRENKVPIMELQWLAVQRAKREEKSKMMMTYNDKDETERQRKAEKRKNDQIEAEEKKKKKKEEEEQLLKQHNNVFFGELDIDEEVVDEKEVMEQEKNVKLLVDNLLKERLGDVAWAVERYLERRSLRRNTMPVFNTARASLR